PSPRLVHGRAPRRGLSSCMIAGAYVPTQWTLVQRGMRAARAGGHPPLRNAQRLAQRSHQGHRGIATALSIVLDEALTDYGSIVPVQSLTLGWGPGSSAVGSPTSPTSSTVPEKRSRIMKTNGRSATKPLKETTPMPTDVAAAARVPRSSTSMCV